MTHYRDLLEQVCLLDIVDKPTRLVELVRIAKPNRKLYKLFIRMIDIHQSLRKEPLYLWLDTVIANFSGEQLRKCISFLIRRLAFSAFMLSGLYYGIKSGTYPEAGWLLLYKQAQTNITEFANYLFKSLAELTGDIIHDFDSRLEKTPNGIRCGTLLDLKIMFLDLSTDITDFLVNTQQLLYSYECDAIGDKDQPIIYDRYCLTLVQTLYRRSRREANTKASN